MKKNALLSRLREKKPLESGKKWKVVALTVILMLKKSDSFWNYRNFYNYAFMDISFISNTHPNNCFQLLSYFSGNFDVYEDELSMDPITVVLFDYESEKVIWHSKPGSSEGAFALVNVGKFHICFGNGSDGYGGKNGKKGSREEIHRLMKLQGHPKAQDDDFNYENTDGYDRIIGFQIRVEPLEGTRMDSLQKEKTQSAEDLATKQTMKLADLSYQLRDRMELLLDHQEYLKGRESYHRNIVEQTFTMVMKWTLFEALILISVACAQVFYLKRFFETKRYL